jgi:hypothetical protein
MRTYSPGEARVPAVNAQLTARDEFLMEIRERLVQARHHYKAFYDRNHREVEFEVGQWMWLRLIHRPIASLNVAGRGKLGPKFYGPFQIVGRIGNMAYKLKLPEGARLHDVFHAGLLKKFNGTSPAAPPPLPLVHHGRACLEPVAILKGRLACGENELLVQWKGRPTAEASWMKVAEFKESYPLFQLVDELLLQGGDMSWWV